MKTRGFEFVKRLEIFVPSQLKLPKRSTKNSAGYDFFLNDDQVVIKSIWKQIPEVMKNFNNPNNLVKERAMFKPELVRTGIKAYMEEEEVLYLYNRSSNPGKLGLILANSVGVIDSDYYNNRDNEGEIMFAFYNIYPFDVVLNRGDKIGQGVFSAFLKADDDNYGDIRVGGIGSTGK